MQKQNRLIYFLLSLPAFVLYSVFFIYPLMNGFIYSLQDWNGVGRDKDFVGISNYITLFSDIRVRNTLSFTLRYTIALLVGTIVLSITIALLLDSIIKARGFFRTMYFMPAVLSTLTVGLIWNQLFSNALPQFGRLIGSESLSSNVLGDVKLAFWAVVFTALWQGLATNVLLFLSALQNIPKDLIEAAGLDGANKRQIFFRIKLPFIIPTLNIVIILTAKNGLMAFDNIFALTSGGPARTTESIGMLIYKFAFEEFKYSYSSALAILIFVIIGILTIIQLRTSERYEVKA